jgi:hypothetical protein
MDSLHFNSIGDEEAIWMERAFEDREVFEVMKALNGDKGPLTFFQTCWEVLKEDIMNVFHEFFI